GNNGRRGGGQSPGDPERGLAAGKPKRQAVGACRRRHADTLAGSAFLSRGPAAARNAISLTGASTLGHDLGYRFQADLFDRLRDLPLIAVGVEKHEDPVPVELVDRFQQDLQTGLWHGGGAFVEWGPQQGQGAPKAVRAFAYLSGPNLMLVMQLIQPPQQQGAGPTIQDGQGQLAVSPG